MSNGVRPPGSAEKSLGEIVSEVSQKASQLIREEIELAKAEVQLKAARLGRGAGAGAVAAFFALMAVILAIWAGAYALALIINQVWFGFIVMAGIMLIIASVAGLFAFRAIKRGTPPTPELAIEEAKKTREVIEEARS